MEQDNDQENLDDKRSFRAGAGWQQLCGGPGKAEMVCVGVTLPTVHMSDGGSAKLDQALRDQVAALLKGPSVTALALQAQLPIHANAEARQSHCGHVLYLTLTQTKPYRARGNS
jgi:hypothetical protein